MLHFSLFWRKENHPPVPLVYVTFHKGGGDVLDSTEKQKLKIISPKNLKTHIYKQKKPSRVYHWRKKFSQPDARLCRVWPVKSLDNRKHSRRGSGVNRITIPLIEPYPCLLGKRSLGELRKRGTFLPFSKIGKLTANENFFLVWQRKDRVRMRCEGLYIWFL